MLHEPNPQSDGAAKTAETYTGSGGGVGVPGYGGRGPTGRIGPLAVPSLIPNWRYQAPRMMSMWCYAAIIALCVGWLILGYLNGQPYRIGPGGITAILALSVLGAVLRLVAQPELAQDVADLM